MTFPSCRKSTQQRLEERCKLGSPSHRRLSAAQATKGMVPPSILEGSSSLGTFPSLLIFVWTPAGMPSWRNMMRPWLTLFTRGFPSAEVQFAVLPLENGTLATQALIADEQSEHGDLALLNGSVFDGHSSSRKYWLMLVWALRFRPHVRHILKQEHDAIVDWHRAVPHLIPSANEQKARYFGFYCDPIICFPMKGLGRCAAGMTSGVSVEFAQWLTQTIELEGCDSIWGCGEDDRFGRRWRMRPGGPSPAPGGVSPWRDAGVEDTQLCRWAKAHDDLRRMQQSQLILDRRGIYHGDNDTFWVHPIKKESEYMDCIANAASEKGCAYKNGAPRCPLTRCHVLTFRLPQHRDHEDYYW